MTHQTSCATSSGVKRIESASAKNRIQLNKKVSVTREFYEFIQELAETVIPHMKPHNKYLLKEIFGNEFWESEFYPVERRIIGMCVARMVRSGKLPLYIVEKKSKYPLQYQQK